MACLGVLRRDLAIHHALAAVFYDEGGPAIVAVDVVGVGVEVDDLQGPLTANRTRPVLGEIIRESGANFGVHEGCAMVSNRVMWSRI
jgi:hypothetical protein